MISPLYQYAATVTRVVDADTLELAVDLGFRVGLRGMFRLASVDAPEMNTVEGRAARDWMVGKVAGRDVVVVSAKPRPSDKYGRWLGVVWLPEEQMSVNEQLLAAGHARIYGT